jgi:hypothetical protein
VIAVDEIDALGRKFGRNRAAFGESYICRRVIAASKTQPDWADAQGIQERAPREAGQQTPIGDKIGSCVKICSKETLGG